MAAVFNAWSGSATAAPTLASKNYNDMLEDYSSPERQKVSTSSYTYDDFLNAARSAGQLGTFTSDDLMTAESFPEYGMSMISLNRDLAGASTDEQRALIAEAQNQLRNNYARKRTRAAQNNGFVSLYQDRIDDMLDKGYQSAYRSRINDMMDRGYQSPYASKIDDLTNRLVTYGSFDFDLENNPLWSTYKKNYLREGDRAAANALAGASNASAGRPSSYAVTAAQQANDYWDTQLMGIIPTLYSQGYTEWSDNYARLLQDLDALRGQDEDAYNRYINDLNLALQQDDSDYSKYIDQLKLNIGQDETDYSRYLDQVNLDYQMNRDKVTDKQQLYSNAMALYQLLGESAPTWALQALGFITDEATGEVSDVGGLGYGISTSGVGYRGGSGGYGGTYVDADTGMTEDDMSKVIAAIDRMANGKFTSQDINIIADTPGALELLMVNEDGTPAGLVPEDSAGRRRIANQLMLEYYGDYMDSGKKTSWTADDQRQEQMMMRRWDKLLNSLSPEDTAELDSLREQYNAGLLTDDDVYNYIDDAYRGGYLSYADWASLSTLAKRFINQAQAEAERAANGTAVGQQSTASSSGQNTARQLALQEAAAAAEAGDYGSYLDAIARAYNNFEDSATNVATARAEQLAVRKANEIAERAAQERAAEAARAAGNAAAMDAGAGVNSAYYAAEKDRTAADLRARAAANDRLVYENGALRVVDTPATGDSGSWLGGIIANAASAAKSGLSNIYSNILDAYNNIVTAERATAGQGTGYAGLSDAEARQLDIRDAYSPYWSNGEKVSGNAGITSGAGDDTILGGSTTHEASSGTTKGGSGGSFSAAANNTAAGTSRLAQAMKSLEQKIQNIQIEKAAQQLQAETAATQAQAQAAARNWAASGSGSSTPQYSAEERRQAAADARVALANNDYASYLDAIARAYNNFADSANNADTARAEQMAIRNANKIAQNNAAAAQAYKEKRTSSRAAQLAANGTGTKSKTSANSGSSSGGSGSSKSSGSSSAGTSKGGGGVNLRVTR